ncbi:polysaccharide export outer membrane protein [Sphingomonas trueperi]|uniref:polysaccharide biosynthesis/export family protein n=1 Tax=Sphingomonas trueperi TaxID=53317 RepID=UPI0033958B44
MPVAAALMTRKSGPDMKIAGSSSALHCRQTKTRLATLTLMLTLSACAALPSNGPTARAVLRQANGANGSVKFRIVDLDLTTVNELNGVKQPGTDTPGSIATLAQDRRADLIGPGDVLSISIFEVGVSLFGGSGRDAVGFDPSARAQNFPDTVVDASGAITLPYLGTIPVANMTAAEAQGRIAAALRGKSQDARALVSIKQNVSNTVFVSGAVNRPGRQPLSLARERLLDAIANAGGSANTSEDTVVRFVRGSNVVEQRLATIRANMPDDVVLNPGDRIELIRSPRTYTVFGAVSKISQVAFETGQVSLAEALARSGGPNDATADPSAIFLFRYAVQPQTGSEEPVIYRLNLLKPESYFLSQHVAMQDKDVIYIANASANQPAKLVNVINQLFAPFVLARQIAR